MKRINYLLILLIIITGCTKNNPEKYILGQWEVQEVYASNGSANQQIQQDFDADLYYFKKIIFYENKQVYIDYLHAQPKLGTYSISEFSTKPISSKLSVEHAFLQEGTFTQKFDFDNSSFVIKKLTRNKMYLEMVGCACGEGIYEQISIDLKKTGIFEKE
jgi:hypothetical protein